MSLGNQEPNAYTINKQQKNANQIINVPTKRPSLNKSNTGTALTLASSSYSVTPWRFSAGLAFFNISRARSSWPCFSKKPTDSGSFHNNKGNSSKGTAAAKNMDCQPKRGNI